MACWQVISAWLPSSSQAAKALSPVAKTFGEPMTRKLASTCRRPSGSRSAGTWAVSSLALTPAVQTTVAASMRLPSARVTPCSSTATTELDRHHSTPSSAVASAITGAMAVPIEAPTLCPRSMMMTRGWQSAPRISRRRAGISQAVSIPVKPPPATTTVLRAGVSGKAARRCIWVSRRSACSIESTLKACACKPSISGRLSWLPAASTSAL
ncbi:hypothetical protein PFRA20S_03095 [Pseudomonas fragi]